MKRKSFRAAVLFNLNKPLKIIDIEFPKEIKKGQILIRLKSSSICGAQSNEISGIKGPDSLYLVERGGYGEMVKIGKV